MSEFFFTYVLVLLTMTWSLYPKTRMMNTKIRMEINPPNLLLNFSLPLYVIVIGFAKASGALEDLSQRRQERAQQLKLQA